MPWLVRGERPGEKDLLFVHVPRCGGTSLTKQFNVPKQARAGRDWYHKLGITYFFYRYKLLETRNFPLFSIETIIVVIQLAVGYLLWIFGVGGSADSSCEFPKDVSTHPQILAPCPPGPPTISMWTMACISFVCSTFLFTAPVSGRVDGMRRAYAFFVGKVLFNFTAAYRMLTGVGDKGYIMHWTASKMVDYGHVSEEDFVNVENFTIVRNPYSRLVSIYMYNRFGPLESFDHFVECWYVKWKHYKETGSTEENDVYCHVLPMSEYTHRNGRQLVKTVIKQEMLKGIVDGSMNVCFSALAAEAAQEAGVGSCIGKVPPRVLKTLREMPHSNRRIRDKPWQDYYSERSMMLALEMYKTDFLLFDYAMTIPGRPELDHVVDSVIGAPQKQLETPEEKQLETPEAEERGQPTRCTSESIESVCSFNTSLPDVVDPILSAQQVLELV